MATPSPPHPDSVLPSIECTPPRREEATTNLQFGLRTPNTCVAAVENGGINDGRKMAMHTKAIKLPDLKTPDTLRIFRHQLENLRGGISVAYPYGARGTGEKEDQNCVAEEDDVPGEAEADETISCQTPTGPPKTAVESGLRGGSGYDRSDAFRYGGASSRAYDTMRPRKSRPQDDYSYMPEEDDAEDQEDMYVPPRKKKRPTSDRLDHADRPERYSSEPRTPVPTPKKMADGAGDSWDDYGDVPKALIEYKQALSRIDKSRDWNSDQKRLHKLIYMRGLHPLLPYWAKTSFKMWGVTVPELAHIFAPADNTRELPIDIRGNPLAGTKALESLFMLSQTVTDYEDLGWHDKIPPTISKAIRKFFAWSLKDVSMQKYRFLRIIFVKSYDPDYRGESRESTKDPDEIFLEDGLPSDEELPPRYEAPTTDETYLTPQQRQARFVNAVSADIDRKIRHLGHNWRTHLRRNNGRFRAPPPTLYAFAVIRHVVMITSHDASDAGNPVVVLHQIRLNDRSQWLWNALSLALPLIQARDAVYKRWDDGSLVVGEEEGSDSEPDL